MPYTSLGKRRRAPLRKAATKKSRSTAMVPIYVAPRRKYGYRMGKMLPTDAYNVITRTTVIGDRSSNSGAGRFLAVLANSAFAKSDSASSAVTSLGSPSIQMQFSFQNTFITCGGTTIVSEALPSYSDIVNMYDQYRISYVEVTILWAANSFNAPSSTTTASPNIWIVKDYDDSNSISLSEAVQYNNVVCWCPVTNPKMVIRIKPKVQDTVYSTALSTGYAPGSNRWISLNGSSSLVAPHYGLKFVADTPVPNGLSTDVMGYFTFCVKYFFEVKNMK